MPIPRAILLCALLLWGAVLSPAPAQGQASRPLVVVVSVSRGFSPKNAAWRDQRLGFGLRQLVGELLFATGRFRFIEEKDEVRSALRTIQERKWKDAADSSESEAAEQPREWGKKLGADWAAWAVVRNAEVIRSRSFLGPFSRGSSKVIVKVRVSAV
ncbi:MAG: hypothetical protein V3V62_11075, partial [bacterium]